MKVTAIHILMSRGRSKYEICLIHELCLRKMKVDHQKAIPLIYKDVMLDCGYRTDLIVADQVIVAVKSVANIAPIHEVQLLPYLKF